MEVKLDGNGWRDTTVNPAVILGEWTQRQIQKAWLGTRRESTAEGSGRRLAQKELFCWKWHLFGEF